MRHFVYGGLCQVIPHTMTDITLSSELQSLTARSSKMDENDLHYQDDLDNETFGDLAEGDPGDLPAFFTTGSSGDQEFTSLMQDLKDAALTEAGADSAAGGLEALYDGTGDFSNFFQLELTGSNARKGTDSKQTEEGTVAAPIKDTPQRLESDTTSLFQSLSAFRAGGGDGGAGDVDDDHGEDILASLGLPSTSGHKRQRQRQLRQEQEEGDDRNLHRRDAGARGGILDDLREREREGSSFDTEQSDWARMQKQFEDMNKSFLQE